MYILGWLVTGVHHSLHGNWDTLIWMVVPFLQNKKHISQLVSLHTLYKDPVEVHQHISVLPGC